MCIRCAREALFPPLSSDILTLHLLVGKPGLHLTDGSTVIHIQAKVSLFGNLPMNQPSRNAVGSQKRVGGLFGLLWDEGTPGGIEETEPHF